MRSRILVLFLVVLIGGAFGAEALSTKVRGHVVNDDGEPLKDVKITATCSSVEQPVETAVEPTKELRKQARKLYNQGVRAHKAGDLDAAAALYRQAADADPQYELSFRALVDFLEAAPDDHPDRQNALELLEYLTAAPSAEDWEEAGPVLKESGGGN